MSNLRKNQGNLLEQINELEKEVLMLKEDNKMHTQTITHICKQNVYLDEALKQAKIRAEDLAVVNHKLEQDIASADEKIRDLENTLIE